MEKELILCADDYAQSESISAAILSLANQQRINAISCLVNMPFWHEASLDLQPIKTSHFIGLHLNLTFGQPLSAVWRAHYGEQFWPLPKLLQRAYTRQLDITIVTAEIQAQIDLFVQDMQIYPDFIDGHQHVQQFPVIRDALLAIYRKQHSMVHEYSAVYPFDVHTDVEPSPCFLRKTYDDWRDLLSLQGFPKRQILALLGGITWKNRLNAGHVFTNSNFGGIYNFHASIQYRTYFKQFLTDLKDGGLIMCHPGYDASDALDPICAFRHHEFDYLSGDTFLQDLQDHAVQFMKKHH
ncbi:MAG: hypothetical protein CK424_01690 [Legionella sp.]|nr:MAG: hypothetical protein CK424_01690 [Legionella sp.]